MYLSSKLSNRIISSLLIGFLFISIFPTSIFAQQAVPTKNGADPSKGSSATPTNNIVSSKPALKEKTYLIRLKKQASSELFIKKKKLEKKKNGKINNINTLVMNLTPSELQSFKTDNDVEKIEEDAPIKKSETAYTQTVPWGIRDIGAEKTSQNTQSGSGIKVAVLDSGISPILI